VHSAAVHLGPLLAAEKSKVPFFIAGGVLAAWALIVSLALGLRLRAFPTSLLGQRAVIAISGVLAVAAVSMAVVTSGSPAKSGEEASSTPPRAGSGASTGASGAAPASPSQGPSAPASPAKGASGSGGAHSTLKLAASPGELRFDKRQLIAKAGSVTINFSNPSALEHNVTIAQGPKVLGATPTFMSGARALTLTLAAGTYTFYCSVPGHRQAGMEGTLKIT
jgi:plastocyanin